MIINYLNGYLTGLFAQAEQRYYKILKDLFIFYILQNSDFRFLDC